ncbi:MAG: RyR domain-containing protein [Fimbriimonas sp.]
MLLQDDPSVQRLAPLVPSAFLSDEQVEAIAQALHTYYIAQNYYSDADEVQRNWDDAPDWAREGSREQARWIPTILELAGFRLREYPAAVPSVFQASAEIGTANTDFNAAHPDHPKAQEMAALEHARWCIERTAAGWKFGPERDNDNKRRPDLVGWADLSVASRNKDYFFVGFWPFALERAGLAISA